MIARFRIGVLPGQPPTQSVRLAATTGATEWEVGTHTVLGENHSQVAERQSSRAGGSVRFSALKGIVGDKSPNLY